MDQRTVNVAKYGFKKKRKLPINHFDRFKLRALRLERGLSQYELALASNIEQATIHRLEKGERGPSYTTIIELSDYFNVPLEYFRIPSPINR